MPNPVDSLFSQPPDSLLRWSPDSLYFYGSVDSASLNRVDSLWNVPVPPPEPVPTFLANAAGGIQVPAGEGLGEIVVRFPAHYDWVFWIFASGLLFLTLVRFAFPRRFQQVMASLLVERSLVGMLREGDLFTERIMLGMMGVYTMFSGLFILILAREAGILGGWMPFGPVAWVWFSAGVVAWWMLRSLLIYILGFIFKTFDATSLYLSRVLSMNMAMSVIMLAILPLGFYGNLRWVYGLLLWVFIGFNIYRVIRSLADGLRMTGFGFSYLLLFAVSVEGLPWLLLAAFLRHNLP
jgi:hypothetical protein